ncbi:MAG TPA: DUF4011 domain-containing protein, partial [Gemmatimonadaceae bacterium]|nr:DUF4011 domain-containing protein [Gemmatimonadaceae bacterium]
MSDLRAALPTWMPELSASLFAEVAGQYPDRVIMAMNDEQTMGLVAQRTGRVLVAAEADQPDFLVITDPTEIDEMLPYVAYRRVADDKTDGAFWVANLAALTSEELGIHFFGRLSEYISGYLAFEDNHGAGQPFEDLRDAGAAVELERRRDSLQKPVNVGAFEVYFETRESISWIGAYNKRPIVNRLAIRSSDGVTYDNIIVELALIGAASRLTEPWAREIPTLGPTGIVWNASAFADLSLDANILSQIAERQHAEFVLTIKHDERVIGALRRDIDVLAPDAWVAGRPLDSYAIDLAGLVQPHEPALRPILAKAAELLTEKMGHGGLSGYQSASGGDFSYVDAMVQSIWEATQSVGIGYSDPPSSWDLHGSPNQQGQRVRLAGQVIGERIGTCLDTTILVASLLAAVDLYPIVFLGEHPDLGGHAFVGYWRDTAWRTHQQFWYLADGHNQIDSGAVVPIETTLLTDASATYAQAVAVGKSRFADFTDFSEVSPDIVAQLQPECAAIDIAVAHRSGTIPLPVRVPEQDGTVSLVEYQAQELSIDLLDRALRDQRSTSAGLQTTDAPRRVKRWMDSLLDLSLRNPLLNYRFSAASSVSLMVPDGFLGRLEDILQTGGSLGLLFNGLADNNGRPAQLTARHTMPEAGREIATRALVGRQELFTNLPPDSFVARMRRMLNNAKSILDETGSNQLHLALGMISWVPEGRAVECSAPLILLPVTIQSSNRSREFALAIDSSSPITPNFSLAEKLRVDAKLDLPKLVAPDLDDAGIDVDGLIKYVRDEFIAAGLTDFRVDESCTLGFFDFSTYRLWKDLKDNWARFGHTSQLVKHLIETPSQPFADSVAVDSEVDLDDFAASLPVQADGSQARAVYDAMQGKTFVLQGPPGTGKSQTITNLLACALHNGKRVLFVAEKPDALTVVRDRLARIGLGAFGLNLHDKGMKPADVRQQISDALNITAIPDKTGFDAASREIDRAIAPLHKYPERLHSDGALGYSVYSARDALLALPGEISLPVPAQFIANTDPKVVDQVRTILKDIRDAASNAGPAADNPWSLARAGSETFSAEKRDVFTALVTTARDAAAQVQGQSAALDYVGSVASLAELMATAPLARLSIDLATVDASAGEQAAQARKYVIDTIEGFAVERLFAGATPRSVEAPTTDLRQVAEVAIRSFFIGRKKKVLAAANAVQEFLAPGTVIVRDSLIPTITELEKLQQQVTQYLSYVRSIPGLFVPPSANLLVAEHRTAIVEQLQRINHDVAFAASDGSPARARLRALITGGSAAAQPVGALGQVLARLTELMAATPESVALWLAGRPLSVVLFESIHRWHRDAVEADFRSLRRWLSLRDLLSRVETAGLHLAAEAIAAGAVPARDVDLAFERALLAGVIRKRIDDEGLDAFDGAQHDALVRRYAASADQLRQLSPGVLAHDMIGNRGFDVGVTVGAIGELKRELSKQRQLKPIRRLLKEHWPVISRATPLVLAIPDALVRF